MSKHSLYFHNKMVLRSCIHLEGGKEEFTPGELVRGVVVLSSTFSDKLFGISVRLTSKVETDPDPVKLFSPYRTSKNEDVHFHNDEGDILFPPSDGTDTTTLLSKRSIIITRGVVHRYPFLLKVPKGIPCTFRGTYGYVAYQLILFTRKQNSLVIGAKKGITIKPFLDLNSSERVLLMNLSSNSVYEETTSHPLPYGGKVDMRVRLGKTYSLPGKDIQFDVKINSASDLYFVTGMRAVFLETSYFRINQDWKTDERRVLYFQGPHIKSGKSRCWSHSFPCPYVYPAGLGSSGPCSIDLRHSLLIELILKDNTQLRQSVNILVGTVGGPKPIESVVPLPELPPSYDKMDAMRGPLVSETPPPRYEDVVGGMQKYS